MTPKVRTLRKIFRKKSKIKSRYSDEDCVQIAEKLFEDISGLWSGRTTFENYQKNPKIWERRLKTLDIFVATTFNEAGFVFSNEAIRESCEADYLEIRDALAIAMRNGGYDEAQIEGEFFRFYRGKSFSSWLRDLIYGVSPEADIVAAISKAANYQRKTLTHRAVRVPDDLIDILAEVAEI